MPETRYVETYKDGVLISSEPYEVSDEELHKEALAQEMNDTHDRLLVALEKWDSLTAAQIKAIVKHLVRFRLWHEGQL